MGGNLGQPMPDSALLYNFAVFLAACWLAHEHGAWWFLVFVFACDSGYVDSDKGGK